VIAAVSVIDRQPKVAKDRTETVRDRAIKLAQEIFLQVAFKALQPVKTLSEIWLHQSLSDTFE
jgi:hypothetical protein